MSRFLLECGRVVAEVDPSLGGAITDLSVIGPGGAAWPVFRPTPAKAGRFDPACFLLVPWSNRIAGAELKFRGRSHALRADIEDGSAHHGVAMDYPWTVTDRSPLHCIMAFDSAEAENANWPWAFTSRVRYEAQPDGLIASLSLTNTSDSAFPAGIGFHPSFQRRVWSEADEVELRAAVGGRYPLRGPSPTGSAAADEVTARMNAGGSLESICDGATLDDVFTLNGGVTMRWPASGVTLTMTGDETLSHLVVYTPRHEESNAAQPYFCVEPVSHTNNAFNLMDGGMDGTGAIVLEPGETISAEMTLRFAFDG